jgi:hypothetical protein
MRKAILIALGSAVALVAAAGAMAALFTASGVSATTATLSTSQAVDVKTRTCTGADGKSFAVTSGRYTGAADFTNPATELDGPLTLKVHTTVDTGSHLGYVEGSFRVKDDDTRLSGRFWGTLDGTGKLAGFLTGASRGHHAVVLGTLSGTFVPATGFSGPASLGTAPSSAALAVLAGRVCNPRAPKPPKPKLVEVHGKVSAIGSNPASLTVTGKGPTTATCVLDASSPSIAGIAIGNRVEMKCENVNNVWTLRKIEKHS